MNKLPTLEYKGFNLLTTKQLSEIYGVEPKQIARNFERNKTRYKEGEHYICLAGEELKKFKEKYEEDEMSKYISLIYLWTAKGCFLQAKSLNSDTAWSIYDKMVNSYFEKNEGGYKSVQHKRNRKYDK